ncbi:hypothetical protein M0R45_024287 [Rubus argutus]|uniref:Late embryogenesis abundant protein LEA-2 subgroup domain-containing protein n=1 Tax=Rubus argutus TaxID=59490 RepID=A0AAW1WSP6_RUBAR
MADKNQQVYPLAPANGYTRSDGESLSEDELKRKKRIKCFAYIGIFIVFQMAVIAVFGLTVMKVKTPKVRLGDSTLSGFTSSSTGTPTFNTQIRIKNTNWGPYKYDAGTVTFLYQNVTVGTADVPKGKAGMRGTKKISVNATLDASALPSGSTLGNELTLSTAAQLTGKVELMLIMKKKKSASMSCTIVIDVPGKSVKSVECK